MNKLDAIKAFDAVNPVIKRTGSIGINWYSLHNQQLVASGISPNTLENWSDMLSIDSITQTFKEHYYISDLCRIFFGSMNFGTIPGENTFFGLNNDNRKSLFNIMKNIHNKMISDADSIIYLTPGNKKHTLLKNILDHIAEGYNIAILDGGDGEREGTTNAECEKTAVMYSEEARKTGKKCIFISSIMGTRSWSNKYVKNVFLWFDNGSFDPNMQKIARAFTPWENHEKCSIFDFRLSYDYPTIAEAYLANMLIRKKKFSNDSINDIIGRIASSDKIAFYDAYKDVNTPFIKRTEDEIKMMLLSDRDFGSYRIANNFDFSQISIPENDIDTSIITSVGVKSDNVKGDAVRLIKTNFSIKINNSNSRTSTERTLIIKYIEFIRNYGFLFNPEYLDKNILNSICKDYNRLKELCSCWHLSFMTVKDILEQFRKCQLLNEFDKYFTWK